MPSSREFDKVADSFVADGGEEQQLHARVVKCDHGRASVEFAVNDQLAVAQVAAHRTELDAMLLLALTSFA